MIAITISLYVLASLTILTIIYLTEGLGRGWYRFDNIFAATLWPLIIPILLIVTFFRTINKKKLKKV